MQTLGPKDDLYADGVTKITDPFYCCICRNCMHRFWSVTISPSCSKCNSNDVYYSHTWKDVNEEIEKINK